MKRLYAPFFALIVGLFAVASAQAVGVLPREHTFELIRDGSPIGSHTIRFSREGEDLVVDIDIRIDVKVLGISFFRYRHNNREIWRGDRLQSIRTRTDDDGEELGVDGRLENGRFVVRTLAGERFDYAPDVVPTSYWNPRIKQQEVLLNSQDGAPLKVSIRPGGRDPVQTDSRLIEDVNLYKVEGELNLNLWYDLGDRLVKLNFYPPGDSTLIDYLRIEADKR